ncbi:hypothetical protein PENTCL1PPCAC_24608, partial [Pristionchus entomophagus]
TPNRFHCGTSLTMTWDWNINNDQKFMNSSNRGSHNRSDTQNTTDSFKNSVNRSQHDIRSQSSWMGNNNQVKHAHVEHNNHRGHGDHTSNI